MRKALLPGAAATTATILPPGSPPQVGKRMHSCSARPDRWDGGYRKVDDS